MSIAKTNTLSTKPTRPVVAEERDFDLPTTPPRQTVSFGTAPIRMKNILVTGASSGIGLAIAKSLVEHGHEVWGTSRNPERLPKIPRCQPVRLDLNDPRSIEQA